MWIKTQGGFIVDTETSNLIDYEQRPDGMFAVRFLGAEEQATLGCYNDERSARRAIVEIFQAHHGHHTTHAVLKEENN